MIRDLLPFVISGLVAGSLYGLAATGLVLTYKTSGVFNFAHGAVGAGAAYLFYDLRDLVGMPAWIAVLLTVGVAAPCLGLLLSLLAARLATVSTAQRIVATVGVLLLVQGTVQLRYGAAPMSFRTSLPTSTFRLAGINVGYDQLITALIALAGVGALSLLFRTSRTGLQMRAVADDDELLGLAGQAPAVVRAKAWMIGSAFAAASGILLAPAIGLDALVLTLVVVQAFGAAAVGRFQRTTLAFAGGVGIGVVQSLLNAPRVRDVVPFVNDLPGLDQAVPFIVLFVVLLATRPDRLHERATPRAPRSRIAYPRPLLAALMVVGTGTAIALPYLFESRVPVYTLGAVFVIIFASLFLLTEVSNQVSLCQVSFVALGATTFCHVTTGLGLPWAVGLVAAGLVAVPMGAIVAIPAIRLSGLFLALATLGFGVLVEKLLYPRAFMFGAFGSRTGSRPHLLGLSDARPYYFLCLALAVASLGLVVAIRRSRLGRLLDGLADSPVALATHGSSINVTRVLVFCISSSLAGIAGALYVGVVGSVSSSGASPTALVSFNSLVWLAVLAFVGRSAILTPLLAAAALVIGPSYLTDPNTAQYLTIGFGLAAVLACAFSDDILRRIADGIPQAQDRVRRSPAAERADSSRQGHPMGDQRGLQVDDLSVQFGGVVAVDELSLRAPAAQITSLIGPNGAGKTTTFNACTGLLRPTGGRVQIDGADVTGCTPQRRAQLGLGRTFQRMELFDSLTVQENVALGREARLAGDRPWAHLTCPPGDTELIAEATGTALALCGIEALADRPVRGLSTGQRRLVELARATAGGFSLLLLDEPSSGLDHAETEAFGGILLALVDDHDTAILLVEHDMSLVMSVSTHLYVLDFGRLIFEGTPAGAQASDDVRHAYLGDA